LNHELNDAPVEWHNILVSSKDVLFAKSSLDALEEIGNATGEVFTGEVFTGEVFTGEVVNGRACRSKADWLRSLSSFFPIPVIIPWRAAFGKSIHGPIKVSPDS